MKKYSNLENAVDDVIIADSRKRLMRMLNKMNSKNGNVCHVNEC
jgi:hypothetical protein